MIMTVFVTFKDLDGIAIIQDMFVRLPSATEFAFVGFNFFPQMEVGCCWKLLLTSFSDEPEKMIGQRI